jgi:hypothetical protein
MNEASNAGCVGVVVTIFDVRVEIMYAVNDISVLKTSATILFQLDIYDIIENAYHHCYFHKE